MNQPPADTPVTTRLKPGVSAPPPPAWMLKPRTVPPPPPVGVLRLTIRPEPDGRDHLGRDPMIRLRLFLKDALRRYGWRCVRVEPVTVEDSELPTGK